MKIIFTNVIDANVTVLYVCHAATQKLPNKF